MSSSHTECEGFEHNHSFARRFSDGHGIRYTHGHCSVLSFQYGLRLFFHYKAASSDRDYINELIKAAFANTFWNCLCESYKINVVDTHLYKLNFEFQEFYGDR
jgi:hypothetical protein